ETWGKHASKIVVCEEGSKRQKAGGRRQKAENRKTKRRTVYRPLTHCSLLTAHCLLLTKQIRASSSALRPSDHGRGSCDKPRRDQLCCRLRKCSCAGDRRLSYRRDHPPP